MEFTFLACIALSLLLWIKYYETKVESRRPHRGPAVLLPYCTQYSAHIAHVDPFPLSQIRSYLHSVDSPLYSVSKIEPYQRSRHIIFLVDLPDVCRIECV